jgi:pilus assembly protein FimV
MTDRNFLSRALTGSLLVALFSFVAGSAWGLSVGKATVQSSLGQGLRAEVEVSSATDVEADSLTADLAPLQAYAASNLDVSPALNGLKVSVQRQAGGNAVIRIIGEQPINEPVLQVLLDVRWSTGKMVRGFTLFIDPPATPEKTKTETGSIVGATPAVVLVPEKIPPVAPVAAAEAPLVKAEAAQTPPAAEPQPSSSAAVTRRTTVVEKGDTTRKIAARLRSDNLTAEQVMLALLRANPDAFVAQNINRLKAGATLTLEPLPNPQTLSSEEAAREVARQAAAWRKGLAAAKGDQPDAKSTATGQGRSTSEKVGPAPGTTKEPGGKAELKLGAAQEKDKAEAEKLAAEMQAKEDSERKAELEKNIEALKEAAATTSQAAGSGSVAAPESEKPAVEAPPPAPAVTAKVPAPASDAPPEGILESLQSLDTTTLAGAGALALLLLAWLIVRLRASATTNDDDGPPPEQEYENQQPVDETQPTLGSREPSLTAGFEESTVAAQGPAPAASPPSVLFADSQLKPSDSLDAVAEADVYLAYGRDAQAEEILREALGVTPNKVELHQKLLDIFVLRGDAEGFAQIAQTMSTYLDSQGPQWLKVCELGALLDGNNPLYHNHASPDSLAPGAFPSAGARPLPMEFPAGLDLNLAKPVDKPAATAVQDFRPSTQVQPLGFEFSSQSLVVSPDGNKPLDTAQPWNSPAGDEGSRLLDQKIELAKEFIAVSDLAGARILLNEVIERAQGSQLEQANQLLAQIA